MPGSHAKQPGRGVTAVRGLAAAFAVAVGVITVVLAVRGSGDSDGVTGTAESPAAGATSSATSPAPEKSSLGMLPAPPAAGACRRLSPDSLTAAVDDTPRTSCRKPHTARTIAVGGLDAGVLDRSGADARLVADQATRQCNREFLSYVQGTAEERLLSRLQPVWFTAEEKAIAAGALWVRCDVVAYGTDERLAELPRRLDGILSRPAGDALALCSTRAPEAERAENVVCSKRHTWRAFSVVRLGRGGWPGVRTVRGDGDEKCSLQARVEQGNPDSWKYAWQWPTRRQWVAGRTYGYCWVPE